jgi:hypothetical protein
MQRSISQVPSKASAGGLPSVSRWDHASQRHRAAQTANRQRTNILMFVQDSTGA